MMDNVIKQGYLKKAHPTSPSSARTAFATSIRQLLEPTRWYVFGLKRRKPVLEYFDKEESVFTSEPINSYDLSTCERITYTLGRTQKNWTFCIFMPGRVLELTADSRERMLSWCQLMERTLHDHGVLRRNNTDHVYSEYPIKRPPRKSHIPSPITVQSTNESSQSSEPTTPVPQDDGETEDIFETLAGVESNLPEVVAAREASRTSFVGTDETYVYSDATWFQDEYSNTNLVKPKSHSEQETSGSEPETTGDEDFLTEDFWLSNKKTPLPPPVPRRTDSMLPNRFAMSYPGKKSSYDDNIVSSHSAAPPLPVRPSSMYVYDSNFFLDDHAPPNLPPRPVAAPRKSLSTCQTESTKTEWSDLKDPITNEQIYDFAKPDCESISTVPSAEDTESAKSEVKSDSGNECMVNEKYDLTYDFHIGNDTAPSNLKNIEVLDDGYQAITELKSLNLIDKYSSVYKNFKKESQQNGFTTHEDEFDLRVSLPVDHENTHSDDEDSLRTPTNSENIRTEEKCVVENPYSLFPNNNPTDYSNNIYDFGILKPVSSVVPTQTADVSLPTQNNPVMPYVTKIPVKPPRRNKNSPKSSPTHSKSNTPTRDFISERSSSPHSSTATSEAIPLPQRKRNIPPLTEYAYVTREQLKNRKSDSPGLPPPRNSKQDSDNYLRKSTGSNVPEKCFSPRRNSPTFDGFQFNLGKMSHQDNSDEDNEPHDYEDATNVNLAPPLPPPRKTNTKVRKSYSVNDASTSKKEKKSAVSMETEEVQPVIREKSVFRQQSLQERQRISQVKVGMTVVPLKQSQVEILQQEQKFHHVKVRIHFASGLKIGIVECFGKVWIAGWDMRTNPRLNDKIHIGDQVMKVNEFDAINTQVVHKIFKHPKSDVVELTLKRLPFAQVIAIRRQTPGQSLGIQREGGSAVITYVDPNGLAAEFGLPLKSKSVESNADCHWCLTEVNSRPLNLTFKGNEIQHRLNAVGKDISIVVQPDDFVKEIKRQLKKLRNFKDFLAF